VIKLKKLNAAAILICIIAAYGVFESIWAIAATEGFIQTWAAMMGTTAKESAVLTMAVQFFGVYHLVALVSLAIVAVIPLRRAERWAWITILVLGAIGLGSAVILWAPYAPVMYVWGAMWIAALALSAKPSLAKKG
jgi:hypothetical protein